jgi:hypothetical protein
VEDSADAGPYYPERERLAQAGTSDGLVPILEDEITPIARSELKAAQAVGVPIFVMPKTGVKRDVELERLVKRIREEGHIHGLKSRRPMPQRRMVEPICKLRDAWPKP